MGTIGLWKQTWEVEFTYHGRKLKGKADPTSGSQPSPFRDGTGSGDNVIVHNLDNSKKLVYALLVPYMIERYGFYEGKARRTAWSRGKSWSSSTSCERRRRRSDQRTSL